MYDFPNAPTVGLVFEGYTWDGEKWILTTGGIPVGGVVVPPVVVLARNYLRGAERAGAGSVITADGANTKTVFTPNVGVLQSSLFTA